MQSPGPSIVISCNERIHCSSIIPRKEPEFLTFHVRREKIQPRKTFPKMNRNKDSKREKGERELLHCTIYMIPTYM